MSDLSKCLLNYSMYTTDESQEGKAIVRISYRIVSTNRFKAMTKKQKQTLIDMIDRFEKTIKVTKSQIKKTINQ